jgi:iron(III) transport system substrate-binding protein
MRDGGLLQPYNSPVLKSYPDDAKESTGKGLYYWALARESYIGFTYNKNLLAAAAVPKNFDGLLHPALKEKMGMPLGGASGSRAIGAMVKARGEEFVRKLKEQQMRLYSLDAPALVNVIAAGEVVASPAIFQSHTWLAATKGAPVEWVPMELVPNNVGSAAIAARPPNPHGAVLMADFLLGRRARTCAGEVSLRQRDQRAAVQALASRARADDCAIRKGRGSLGETAQASGAEVAPGLGCTAADAPRALIPIPVL